MADDDDESFATVEDTTSMVRRYEDELRELREEKAEAEAARKRAETFFDEVVATVKSGIELNEELESRCRNAEAEAKRLAILQEEQRQRAQEAEEKLLTSTKQEEATSLRKKEDLIIKLKEENVSLRKACDSAMNRESMLREEAKATQAWYAKEMQDLESRFQALRNKVKSHDEELARRKQTEDELKQKLQEQNNQLQAEQDARHESERELSVTKAQYEKAKISTSTNTSPRPQQHKKLLQDKTTSTTTEVIATPPPKAEQEEDEEVEEPQATIAPIALLSLERRFAHGGLRILKHGRNGAPRWRVLNFELGALTWQSGKDTHRFELVSVTVRKGKTTPVFQRRASRSALAAHCFSLISTNDDVPSSPSSKLSPGVSERFSLDLQAESMHERDVLSEGFELLILKIASSSRSPPRAMSPVKVSASCSKAQQADPPPPPGWNSSPAVNATPHKR